MLLVAPALGLNNNNLLLGSSITIVVYIDFARESRPFELSGLCCAAVTGKFRFCSADKHTGGLKGKGPGVRMATVFELFPPRRHLDRLLKPVPH